MGQDDSVVHGKHLPPSPRRQPSIVSLKLSKQTAPAVATTAAVPPTRDTQSSKLQHHETNSESHPPPPGRRPQDRYSCSPLLFHRVTPPVALSHTSSPVPVGRLRTISDPQAGTEPPQAQSQTAYSGIIRRKVLSKETVRHYQEKALQRQGSKGQQEGQSKNRQSAMQVPWEKEVSKDGLMGLGLCLGQTKDSAPGVALDQSLLEEIESMCCLGSVTSSGPQPSQVHRNNSLTQGQDEA